MTTVLTAKKQSKYYHMESQNFIYRVGIVQRLLPHYRLPFFQELRNFLALRNVKLDLIYGQGNLNDKAKKDQDHLHWGIKLKNFYLPFNLVYQPCLYRLKKYDIVIIEQANILLINYYLLLKKNFTRQKVAFWGHGCNMQASRNSMANKFKALYSTKVDWWFAYTKGTKKVIISAGFPGERVTVVQNSINTDDLIKAKHTFSAEDIQTVRRQFGLHNCKVGLYCGGMYKEKRLNFLLDACKCIKQYMPSFQMIFIGDGPDFFILKQASNKKKWIHFIGPKFGYAKVKYYLMSDIILNPGAVGLSIIDTFVLERPLVTTRMPYHGPEIEYLRPNTNGVLSDNSLEAFSKAAINLFSDDDLLHRLKKGCRESASDYTMKKMVNNFGDGILSCLRCSK